MERRCRIVAAIAMFVLCAGAVELVTAAPTQLICSEDGHMLPSFNLEAGALLNYDDGYVNGYGVAPYLQFGILGRIDVGIRARLVFSPDVKGADDVYINYYDTRGYDTEALDVGGFHLAYFQPRLKVHVAELGSRSSIVAYGSYTQFEGDPVIVEYPEDGVDDRAIGVTVLDAEEGWEVTLGTTTLHRLADVTNIRFFMHAGFEATYVRDKEWLEPQREGAFLLTPMVAPQLVLADRWSVQLENRFEYWLKRGYHYELIPGVRWEPFPGGVAQAGMSVPVYGGDVFRFFAGFSYKIGRKDFRIRTHDIHFPPNQAILFGPENERSDNNRRILTRLARRLQRYPDYTITVEGHTSWVYWDDPVKGPREQQEVLVPLSQARANAVMNALSDMGIEAARMQAVGRGGSAPLVPFSEKEEQWRNRRVEFALSRE